MCHLFIYIVMIMKHQTILKNRDLINLDIISEYFGFEMNGVIPNIYSNDYDFYSVDFGNQLDVQVDLYDWEDDDFILYVNFCDNMLEDVGGKYKIAENFYLYINAYINEETGRVTRFVNIYTTGAVDSSGYEPLPVYDGELENGTIHSLSDIVDIVI